MSVNKKCIILFCSLFFIEFFVTSSYHEPELGGMYEEEAGQRTARPKTRKVKTAGKVVKRTKVQGKNLYQSLEDEPEEFTHGAEPWDKKPDATVPERFQQNMSNASLIDSADQAKEIVSGIPNDRAYLEPTTTQLRSVRESLQDVEKYLKEHPNREVVVKPGREKASDSWFDVEVVPADKSQTPKKGMLRETQRQALRPKDLQQKPGSLGVRTGLDKAGLNVAGYERAKREKIEREKAAEENEKQQALIQRAGMSEQVQSVHVSSNKLNNVLKPDAATTLGIQAAFKKAGLERAITASTEKAAEQVVGALEGSRKKGWKPSFGEVNDIVASVELLADVRKSIREARKNKSIASLVNIPTLEVVLGEVESHGVISSENKTKAMAVVKDMQKFTKDHDLEEIVRNNPTPKTMLAAGLAKLKTEGPVAARNILVNALRR